MSSAKRKELVECHHCSSGPVHPSSWQILDFPKYIKPQSSWPKSPIRRKWVFQANVGHLGALQTRPGGWLNQWSHLRKWSMWLGSDDDKEALSVDLLASWPLETSLSVWFHRTLQPLLLAAARRKTLCMVNGVWSPELHLFPQPFPSSCALPLSHHWDTIPSPQIFLQPLSVRKLFLFPLQPPYIKTSQRPVLAL